ncbi:MAG: class I SAM-dependent methyltransferase [Opitutae bacterium]|nr:class I SAM-dependent methyltransferase [Opitutae bacterium]
MGLRLFQKSGPLKGLIFRLWLLDARAKERSFLPFLDPADRILDLGSGPGSVCRILRARGFAVTPVDVQDVALDPSSRPQLYDGRRLPFASQSYDVALLLTVLHHTSDPARVLAEAARVARRVIVIEDVYSSPVQRWLTHRVDSLLNLEFRGHPHTNRTDPAWRSHFAARGWRLVHTDSRRIALFFRQQTYILDCVPRPRPISATRPPPTETHAVVGARA